MFSIANYIIHNLFNTKLNTMSNTKQLHTEGKLTVAKFSSEVSIKRDGSIYPVLTMHKQNGLISGQKDAIDTAERIVTCVNAMDGLSNEEVDRLRKYNADLLKVLENLLNVDQLDAVEVWSVQSAAFQLINKSKQPA